MTIHVGVSSVNKNITKTWIGVGGVWKRFGSHIGSGSAWKKLLAVGGTYTGTFTSVDTVDGGGNGTIGTTSGASPTTDSEGMTVAYCIDTYTGFVYTGTLLGISGFSSDPGATYFTTASIDGTPRTAATASYGYSTGTATWTWNAGAILTAGAGKSLSYV